jgi:hypothetical protein
MVGMVGMVGMGNMVGMVCVVGMVDMEGMVGMVGMVGMSTIVGMVVVGAGGQIDQGVKKGLPALFRGSYSHSSRSCDMRPTLDTHRRPGPSLGNPP